MDRELANTIVDAMNESGYDAEIYEDYSGRGMYGKTTTAIQIDRITELVQAIIECAEMFVNDDGYAHFPASGNFNSDSLGLGMVVY